MPRKGYGRQYMHQHVEVGSLTDDERDRLRASARKRSVVKMFGGTEVIRKVRLLFAAGQPKFQVQYWYTSHNEHNTSWDLSKQIAALCKDAGIADYRVKMCRTVGAPTWTPLYCKKHDNCCHTVDHKAGRCECAMKETT